MSVLAVDGVWKVYPRWSSGPRTLRGFLSRRVPTLLGRHDEHWVLRDVSLAVARGEAVGVIGGNGAGKSTLLRLIAGLGRPTRGRIDHESGLRAVLTLGDTFDLTLSGWENATTSAIVAGCTPAQAAQLMPSVFDFAELAEFAQAPVRTYSDGMKLRLAMSTALHLPADLFVVDEVLAVGDLRFQERCLEHLRDAREEGLTMLFASHDLDRVERECDRVVWLHGGNVRAVGPVSAVVERYRTAMMSETLARTPASPVGATGTEAALGHTRYGSQEITIEDVGIAGGDGALLRPGTPVSIRLSLRRRGPIDTCVVAISIRRRSDGVKCLDINTASDGVRVVVPQEGVTLRADVDALALEPGEYDVEVGAYQPGWAYAYDLHTGMHPLDVAGSRAGDGILAARARWIVEEARR